MFKRLIIFGASQGLGRALSLHSFQHLGDLAELHLVSRKTNLLNELTEDIQKNFKGKVGVTPLDLTLEGHQAKACELVKNLDFDCVIYCAGGGPHGKYVIKEWKDHAWALQLNLLAPARLIHQWLGARRNAKDLGKFVVVGSRIAENSLDPLAASYSSGKSGINGLISSLQPELEKTLNKVWLFSPGYMDTGMLPTSAKVRHDGSKIMSPEAAAQALLRWIKKDNPWHRVLN